MKKVENYLRALDRLDEAVHEYSRHQNNAIYRDGLIQRFEFCTELAWKSPKEFLEAQGLIVEYSTPKSVLKNAYAAGYLDQTDVWLDIISARNQTPHIYSEDVAISIAHQICSSFMSAFQSLADFYSAGDR